MKLTRRTFLKLVPVGIALTAASWWILTGNTGTVPIDTGAETTSESSAAMHEFPEAWSEHADHPVVDSRDYLLRVDGDVSNPLQLTLDELYAMPSVSQNSTIRCVEGWDALVVWEGIPLSRLLSLAGASKEYDHVTVESLTGYATRIERSDAANSGTMIALKAASAPLNNEHGYPARLVLPTRPGYEWVKQVVRITCIKS